MVPKVVKIPSFTCHLIDHNRKTLYSFSDIWQMITCKMTHFNSVMHGICKENCPKFAALLYLCSSGVFVGLRSNLGFSWGVMH